MSEATESPRRPDPPPPSLQGQCHMCQLYWDNREAYDWLSDTLMAYAMPQADIVTELEARWGIKSAVAQLSRHRTRHLAPDFAESFRTQQAAEAVARAMGAKTPEEIRQAVIVGAIVEIQGEIASCPVEGTKRAAYLSTLFGRLNQFSDDLVANGGSGARLAQEIAELQRDKLALEKATAEGKLEDLLYQYIADTRPDLLAQLAQRPTQASAASDEEAEA